MSAVEKYPVCEPSRALRMALLVLGSALASACETFPDFYQPRATIGLSPQTIPLRIEVRDLQDLSPADDRSRLFGGGVATSREALPGELSMNVTLALVDNFQLDEVFTEVSREPASADLVMSGTIRRFYGKAHENLGGWAALLAPSGINTYLIYLGFPIYSSYGCVDLELTFDSPGGQRVAVYGTSKEFSDWSSMYWIPHHAVGAKLNRAFSEAVADLREQMLADRERLLSFRDAERARESESEAEPEPEP